MNYGMVYGGYRRYIYCGIALRKDNQYIFLHAFFRG